MALTDSQKRILYAEIKRDNVEYTDLEEECLRIVKEMGDKSFLKPILEYEYRIRGNRDYKFIKKSILKYHKRKMIEFSYERLKKLNMADIKPRRKILPTYLENQVSFPGIAIKSIPLKRFDVWKELFPPIGKRIEKNFNQFILKNEGSLTLDYFQLPIIENDFYTSPKGAMALVKIDFSKSENDILKYITNIKKTYDNNPLTIQNIPEYLNYQKKPSKMDKLDIDVQNDRITAINRHCNRLFIYDCKRLGLPDSYIMSEIDRYQKIVKHEHDESFNVKTISKYFTKSEDLVNFFKKGKC